MRVHWLQHADFEDPGSILPWLSAHGHPARGNRLHAGDPLPALEDFDTLIVMGGPMNIHEHERHPWLVAEKALIRAAIDAGKRVLGICLGAQLIADQLGGPVTRNDETEIGWFPVTLTREGRTTPLFAGWPETFTTFHWHGDTYALPPGAECLASSAACAQQAFAWDGGRVLGLQFHPEVTADSVREWFRHEAPKPARYVQRPDEILARSDAFAGGLRLTDTLLDRFFA
jgi:GMP synthase-like glutamine amidotransferase